MPGIGIDLGTTYSCVACLLNGKVEIIANEFGHRTTPSVVSFQESEEQEVVGNSALSQAARFPTTTLYDAKRMIGRNFNDLDVQEDMLSWPFEVVNHDRKLKMRVKHREEEKHFTPEEVSAMVLKKMKVTAEAYLGTPVEEAVITVPAYFTDRQKRATKEAGVLAGLRVLRIVPEPSAAALAYGYDRKDVDSTLPRRVLIYDFGGGTFDCTIATIKGSVVKVVHIGGDPHLGGQDIDRRVVKYLAEEIKNKTGRDLLADPRRKTRLRTLCEAAKCNLSALTRVDLDVVPLIGDELPLVLSRAKFEDLNKDLLHRTIECVKQVLEDAELKPEDIEEVILVGGSTRMPCVARFLKEVFPGTDVLHTVNPDEVVAHGAALLAAFLAKESSHLLSGILMKDMTPMSIGIAEEDGAFKVLIPRHSAIPARAEWSFLTVYDNQSSLSLVVYQGERSIASFNQFIGEYTVDGLPPQPPGLSVDVALVVDEDGVLSVKAKHPVSGQWDGCVLSSLTDLSGGVAVGPTASLDCGRTRRMEDVREMARLRARFNLTKYLRNTTYNTYKKSGMECDASVFQEASKWLEKNQNASRVAFLKKLTEIQLGAREKSGRIAALMKAPVTSTESSSRYVDLDTEIDDAVGNCKHSSI